MIFHPTVMALFAGSILVSFMILYSASYASLILKKWDLQSGSEVQLNLERKTYLISTLLAYAFGFELLSFFLFVFTSDQIHTFFVGAMCAAGSLYANDYGYPTLIVKLLNFLLAGIWLILNYVDNQGYDYPLIKAKSFFLLVLVPLILLETFLQANYFLRLKPNIITSCCGTLFSTDTLILPSELGAFSGIQAKAVFYLTLLLTVGAGSFYFFKGKGAYLFSGASAIAFAVSVVSIFSFVSCYVYELPTHHCPFCILQKEYGYIGYLIYVTLLGGAITGLSVGVLMPFRKMNSLSEILPNFQRRLAMTSSTLFLVFTAIVTVRILLSGLVMEGY
jgi:positive regulator of sigma E activity